MARISKLRDIGSFRRRSGRKPPRSITLIVCEGDTEHKYFEAARKHFRLSTAEVVIPVNTKGSAPISVVDYAEKKCTEQGGYDQVYCVFDRDGHESFTRARNRIRELAIRKKRPLPIKEAISIPCFELWVLLHFERTDAAFASCADVIKRIHDHHMEGYEKAADTIYPPLMDRLDTALANADWLAARAQDNEYNPYTSVQQVLRHFAAIASQDVAP